LLLWCGVEVYVSSLQDAAASCKPQHEIPQAATTLELLRKGKVVPETC